MKKLKLSRMFWMFVVTITTAVLAILSGFLQYKENLDNAKKALAKETELSEAYKELAKAQKESLNYIIGAESFCVFSIQGGSNITLFGVIYHQGKYPVYDLEFNILEVDLYQKVLKKDSNANPLNFYKKEVFGNLPTGEFKPYEIHITSGTKKINIFYSARSGRFTQEIIIRDKPIPNSPNTTRAFATAVKNSEYKIIYTFFSKDFLDSDENRESFFSNIPIGETRMQ
jgi:hypothetical protein